MRKVPLVNDECYHIFNRSIASFIIFNNIDDYMRMLDIIDMFRFTDFNYSYSHYAQLTKDVRLKIKLQLEKTSDRLVDIICYCLMPTHPHLILKQKKDNGILLYMSRVLNSYARYFNTKYNRKGPLWEGHFKSVLIDTDELLLHITRYLHLNAVTAKITEKPELWPYSSYSEYLNKTKDKICNIDGLFEMSIPEYKKFVNDQISYQRDLAKIKHLLIENYYG